jgi:hypothetical protein
MRASDAGYAPRFRACFVTLGFSHSPARAPGAHSPALRAGASVPRAHVPGSVDGESRPAQRSYPRRRTTGAGVRRDLRKPLGSFSFAKTGIVRSLNHILFKLCVDFDAIM